MARTSTNTDQLWLQVQMALRAGDDEIKVDRPHCLPLCTVLIASAKSTRRMHTTLCWGQGQVGVVFFREGQSRISSNKERKSKKPWQGFVRSEPCSGRNFDDWLPSREMGLFCWPSPGAICEKVAWPPFARR